MDQHYRATVAYKKAIDLGHPRKEMLVLMEECSNVIRKSALSYVSSFRGILVPNTVI